jgi:hypothetical protein
MRRYGRGCMNWSPRCHLHRGQPSLSRFTFSLWWKQVFWNGPVESELRIPLLSLHVLQKGRIGFPIGSLDEQRSIRVRKPGRACLDQQIKLGAGDDPFVPSLLEFVPEVLQHFLALGVIRHTYRARRLYPSYE